MSIVRRSDENDDATATTTTTSTLDIEMRITCKLSDLVNRRHLLNQNTVKLLKCCSSRVCLECLIEYGSFNNKCPICQETLEQGIGTQNEGDSCETAVVVSDLKEAIKQNLNKISIDSVNRLKEQMKASDASLGDSEFILI